MNNINKLLLEYNGIIKENEKLYRHAAKALGLSDSAFWILYTLREMDSVSTQRDIINAIYMPPQTINSALKKLESEGFVALCNSSDKRKKQVTLTKKGEQLAEKTADKVLALEMETMESLAPQELEAFIGLFRRYSDLLKKNFSRLDKENTIEQL